jgi:GNAT superfamily N-acetyltransferase
VKLVVAEAPVEAVYDLRRRVLRPGRPEHDIAFAEDEWPGCFHLTATPETRAGAGVAPVGIATFFPSPTGWRPDTTAWQLRGMAVDPTVQGTGVGRRIIEAAVDRLRADRADVLWANVRDSAAGFYQRLGWKVVGEGFVTLTGLPHHVAIFDL